MKRIGFVAPARAALILAAILLTACSMRPDAPTERAELFLEKLVMAPHETAELGALAVLPSTGDVDALVDGIAARAGLAYFRARARLGADIQARASDSSVRDDQMVVSVDVREGYTSGDVVHFRVELIKQESGWRVTRVTVD